MGPSVNPFKHALCALALTGTVTASVAASATTEAETASPGGKPVVYQVFTRLFGNKNTANVPWGTIEQNGVGKFSDFTDKALDGIKELGVTHIWYTGVPHHAVIRDYRAYGISSDDPDVVKGRAGSPYAVKDYYNVNPDLASDPATRLAEFEALIDRTHAHGMKVIIDIVPNHVARGYQSLHAPAGVRDFGADDDTSKPYARTNDFYYIPDAPFAVPEMAEGYAPLGGAGHPLADGRFDENPAKWTGNGAREAKPRQDDWYETVKINYGVRPDGSHDFPSLPDGFETRSVAEHAAFWADKSVPPSWNKYRHIALYWLDKGVDGFRFDVAELVPVEFWSYLNSAIKSSYPDAFLLAEVYQPPLYRPFIQKGKMDYLYDKVGLYDTLKAVIQGRDATDAISKRLREIADISPHMLTFLENHDEQRIASPNFAGDARRGKPAMTVTALAGQGPVMLYFGQDVGEKAEEDLGFGDPTRTSIFDYGGVPAHQRWMNDGAFDGGALTADEASLRSFYRRLMSVAATSPAMAGPLGAVHEANRAQTDGYSDRIFSFTRGDRAEWLIVATNFDAEHDYHFDLLLPADIIAAWGLHSGDHSVADQLSAQTGTLTVQDGVGRLAVTLAPLQSSIFAPSGD